MLFRSQDFVGVSSFFSSSTYTNFAFITGTQVVNDGGSSFSATIGSFTGITTTISNKIINLGVYFEEGLANPEINNKSGNIVYIDNRPVVTRNSRQKEDVKIILEF